MPPSAKSRHCTRNTTLMHSRAVAGPDEDGGQRAAEQVAAGAGAHGEVQHLGREDERRDEPGERGGAVVELAAGPAQREADAHRGDDTRGDGRRRVQETVGHVHG